MFWAHPCTRGVTFWACCFFEGWGVSHPSWGWSSAPTPLKPWQLEPRGVLARKASEGRASPQPRPDYPLLFPAFVASKMFFMFYAQAGCFSPEGLVWIPEHQFLSGHPIRFGDVPRPRCTLGLTPSSFTPTMHGSPASQPLTPAPKRTAQPLLPASCRPSAAGAWPFLSLAQAQGSVPVQPYARPV